ncbi:MAG: hypothetical protein ACREQ5_25675 [Candidatus Dormibacteria bacterium]
MNKRTNMKKKGLNTVVPIIPELKEPPKQDAYWFSPREMPFWGSGLYICLGYTDKMVVARYVITDRGRNKIEKMFVDQDGIILHEHCIKTVYGPIKE